MRPFRLDSIIPAAEVSVSLEEEQEDKGSLRPEAKYWWDFKGLYCHHTADFSSTSTQIEQRGQTFPFKEELLLL